MDARAAAAAAVPPPSSCRGRATVMIAVFTISGRTGGGGGGGGSRRSSSSLNLLQHKHRNKQQPPVASLISVFFLNSRVPSHPFPGVSVSPSTCLPPHLQAADEPGTVVEEPPYQPKTVQVKFILNKECLFGEHFLLVGDDPVLGQWDTSIAMPLEWSDGHIWAAQLDLPIQKQIQFKFILRGIFGEIRWQPGPDRVLQTWETTDTIVVSEDWENVGDQKITLEERMLVSTEEMIHEESGTTRTSGSRLVVDEILNKKRPEDSNSSLLNKEVEEEYYGSGDEQVLLVPGLAAPPSPVPNMYSDHLFPGENGMGGSVAETLVSLASDGAESRVPEEELQSLAEVQNEEEIQHDEGNMQHGEENQHGGEIALGKSPGEEAVGAMLSDDQPVQQDNEHPEEDTVPKPAFGIFSNDIQWGRQTIHNLLLALGLSQQE